MKDPAFQAEMRRMTNSPQFKNAMAQATKMTEEMKNDPKKAKVCMYIHLIPIYT